MLSLKKFFIASHPSESPLNKPSTTVNNSDSPSASCDSIARDWLSNGEYARAFERLEALIEPTRDDVHNAGIALWGLGRLEDALEYLNRALALGAPLAVVDIAALESLRGDGQRAADRLARLNLETLTPFERVRALYTHAEILRHNEALSASAARFHEAWYACEIAGDADRREPIALALALTLHEMGDATRAEGWFNRAERFASPPRLDLVRLERALSAARRGLMLPGLTLLETLGTRALSPYRRALADLLEGWCHSSSDPERAVTALERAAGADTGTRELEIPARLRLSAVQLSLGQTLQARVEVARTARLPMNRVRRNEVKVRRANVALAEGNAPEALRLALEARTDLEALEHHREFAVAQLAVARASPPDSPEMIARFDELADTVQFIGTGLIDAELGLIPDLERLTVGLSPYALATLGLQRPAAPAETPRVSGYRLLTFGRAELHGDGRPVRLRTARMIDLLAYLHTHPAARLEEVLRAVFADAASIEAGRSYFGRLRHLIHRQLPGLRVEPQRRLKTYSLEADVPLTSDYEEVNALLAQGDPSAFRRALALRRGDLLEEIGASWAGELREQIDHRFASAGFRAMARLYDAGDLMAALEVGVRLLEINALDPMVAAYRVEILREVEGELAAHRALEESLAVYRRERLELPEQLLALRGRLTLLN